MEQLVEWLVGQVWSIGLVIFALGAGVFYNCNSFSTNSLF